MAPASVRDQLHDHKIGSATAGYYLDQDDTKTCLLGRPSNEIVQKTARLAGLNADANIPTELSEEQQAKFRTNPKLIRLSKRNKALTTELNRQGYRPWGTAKGTRLYDRKIKAEARLTVYKIKLRDSMMEKARKRHFRKADTIAFDSQFSASSTTESPASDEPEALREYAIPERTEIVR